ncbi:MAG TPA: glycoside hydrolase family 2 TIM barrel-domain containing protein, partial [Streptosporangiaceae bacterium]|nr:glycoside hydrolase family 2 TIM barrel-domain containing protein [Streptosporangiaceae bacterium]
MPSLPATDDGSARPLSEDLSTGSGDGEDISWDADAADAGEVRAAAGAEAGPPPAEPRSAGAEPRDGDVGAGRETAGPKRETAGLEGETARTDDDAAGPEGQAAGPEGDAKFTEADVALLAAPPEAGQGTGAPGVSAAPQKDATGQWFRPAKAKKEYVPIPPEEPAGGAGHDAAAADAEPDGGAVATEGSPEQAAEPEWARQEQLGGASQEQPGGASWERTDWTAPYRAAGWAMSAAGRVGSAAGRMSALLRADPPCEGGASLAPGLDGPELGGPVLAPPPEGPVLAPPGQEPGGIRRRLSRRTMLQAGLIGGAGVAALPLLALVGGVTRTDDQPAGLAFSMNTNWLFGGQYTSGSETSSFDDSTFAPVTVPHTVVPLSWKDWDYLAWQQVWTYRRHFSGAPLLDPHRPGNRILVDFDGVMVNATVSINDQVVATHQGGYLPFSAEITSKVTSGDNLLAVVVDSRCLPVPPVGVGRGPASVDFFQPGGIYRDVRLRVLPQVFLADLYARPADVLGSQPRVDIECTLDSAATAHVDGTLLVQLFDGQQQIAAQATGVKADSPGTTTARLSLTGFGPVSLWSPDSPKLYTVQATLNVPGIGSHMLSRRIGFREASFRPDGFFLNGKRLQLFGLNRHQLYPYAGMAMGVRVQRKDAEILKNEFNCNMVRCSHYPQSPDFLDACDELGLLVWEEAPGWHNVSTMAAWQDAVVRDVRDMVIRDRSRPSVIIWGTRLNECKNFPGLWVATRQAARELDGTRPSSGAMAFHEHGTWK